MSTIRKIRVATVHRLHKEPQSTVVEKPVSSSDTNPDPYGHSYDESIERFKRLHKHMLQRQYTPRLSTSGQMFTDDVDCEFGEDGGELQGQSFTLKVHGQKTWRENRHFVRVREQDPTPYLKQLEGSKFYPQQDTLLVPVYDVEVKANTPDTMVSAMDLYVPAAKQKDLSKEFAVLQQDKSNLQWQDITSKCKTDKNSFDDSVIITIPIDRSSKIWIVRVKRSLRSLLHIMMALLVGQILFRILVFYKVHAKEVYLRVIGISEELYQNQKGLKTDVGIAEEAGFQMAEASDAKKLLKKGKLVVAFYLGGNCIKSVHFDIGGSNVSKVAQRGDFKFRVDDLRCIPKVVVRTANENETVCWSIDLRNLIQVPKPVETFTCIKKPKFSFCDEEVKEQDIPWLAHEVNKDWEKLAVCLEIATADIEIIKGNDTEHNVERRCLVMLQTWRKKSARNGRTPSWAMLQEAFQNPVIGRADIFRHIQSIRDEISDRVFLELSHELGGLWRKLGRCLNMPGSEIDIIDGNEERIEDKCLALLRKWSRLRSSTPSVNELIEALRDPVIQRVDIAQKLAVLC